MGAGLPTCSASSLTDISWFASDQSTCTRVASANIRNNLDNQASPDRPGNRPQTVIRFITPTTRWIATVHPEFVVDPVHGEIIGGPSKNGWRWAGRDDGRCTSVEVRPG